MICLFSYNLKRERKKLKKAQCCFVEEEPKGTDRSTYVDEVLFALLLFVFLFYYLQAFFGATILAKKRVEIRIRDLGHLKMCQTGLEVHFKEPGGYYGNRNARSVSRVHFWCS